MWEQNDRGGISGGSTVGTALVSNLKQSGPLFRQFGTAANVSATDTLLTPSPGENAVTTDPTRVFPDIAQIAGNNTNAASGACPTAPVAPALVPNDIRDCFSEFLPTPDWVGFPGDRTLNFRLTARDAHPGGGGIGRADTKLVLANGTGPFLVTSQGSPATLLAGSEQPVTWDVAGTNAAPISASDVKISLSTDGGATYPTVLAASTPNDGSATVTLPHVETTKARMKVEAVGNVFFDISDADVTIQEPILGLAGLAPAVDELNSTLPEAFRNVARSSGAVNKLNVYVENSTTAGWLVAGIYSDANGHPGTLLGTSDGTPVTKGAWNTVDVPSVSLSAGQPYWIAIMGQGGTLRIRTFSGGKGTENSETGRSTRGALSATWRTVKVFKNDGPASAYASGSGGGTSAN
jgi:hypothetical protein